jgi:3-oxoadipate enol-lactonase
VRLTTDRQLKPLTRKAQAVRKEAIMKYQIQGLSINVEQRGTGEPELVFLHYWDGSARTWNAATSQLSADFRCIAYDQRAWGHPDAPPETNLVNEVLDSRLMSA